MAMHLSSSSFSSSSSSSSSFFFFFFILLLLSLQSSPATLFLIHAHASSSLLCSSIVRPHGYPCFDYRTITKDGFILGVQRIPYGRYNRKMGQPRPPIFIQHGLFTGGESWFLDEPERSLGFVLADAGFDVWIGNTRGTQGSGGNLYFPWHSKEFWNWSWDELATYDLPSTIELVYNVTKSQIFYVGHSQGTLIALATFSEGIIAERIAAAALLAPIAFLNTISSLDVHILLDGQADKIIPALSIHALNPHINPLVKVASDICIKKQHICASVLTSITGPNCCLDYSRTPYYLKYAPQPSSVKNLLHFVQMIKTGTFSKYNYGPTLNYEKYGYYDPPPYNISNIPRNLHMLLAYGGRDTLSVQDDVLKIVEMLHPNVELLHFDSYAHLDFVVGTTAKHQLFEPLIAFFKSRMNLLHQEHQ